MKKVLFTAMMAVLINTISFSREPVSQGKTHSSFGDYMVEVADNSLNLNGETLKTFLISYQNSPITVRVSIINDEKCVRYIVLSEKLSVQYVCNKNAFGVQKLGKDLQQFSVPGESINKEAYSYQKKITNGQNSELESTRLIAVYFPMLLTDAGYSVNS